MSLYNDLLKMDNVILLHPNTNSFDLSINALAVATVSGTVGWEALFYGIPTLVFGDAFYKYSKGVYQIKRLEDCQRAIRQIMTEGKLSSTFFEMYLYYLDQVTFDGVIDEAYLEGEKINVKENAEKVSFVLIDAITKA